MRGKRSQKAAGARSLDLGRPRYGDHYSDRLLSAPAIAKGPTGRGRLVLRPSRLAEMIARSHLLEIEFVFQHLQHGSVNRPRAVKTQ
jgi:hypothetical protein